MDNQQLVDRIIRGDTEAFAEMVEKYQNVLYSASFHVLGDFHLAQDIAQEAFIKAYMHISTLENPDRLGSWLYSIAYRLSLNVLRSKKKMEPLEHYSHMADSVSLEESVMRKSDKQRVWHALSKLGENNRLPVLLHYFGALSVTEIARIVCASPEAVESRIRRARKQLKKELLKTMEELFTNEQLGDGFKKTVLSKIFVKDAFILAGYRVAAPFSELGLHVRASVRKIYDHLDSLSNRKSQDIHCLIPPQALDPNLPVLFVGIEVSEQSNLPEGMETIAIPRLKYAVSTFRGTLDQYDEFFRSIPGVIAKEGFEPINMWQGYNFELYPEDTYHWLDDHAFQEIRLHWAIK